MVITFASLKGGVGKTTNAIMVATNLAARGKKVLVYDIDTNNSSTMYFTTGIENINDIIEQKNVFESISHNKLIEYTFPSRIQNIDICPSHLNLDKMRTCSYNELSKTLKDQNTYDYIIIDTAPHYDNIFINALLASDIVLTPIELNSYNLTTTSYLESRIYDDCEGIINKWYLVHTRWFNSQAKNPESTQNYINNIFESKYSNRILDVHIPFTNAAIHYTQESNKHLNINTGVGEKRLATEINKLCNMIEGVDGEEFYIKKF